MGITNVDFVGKTTDADDCVGHGDRHRSGGGLSRGSENFDIDFRGGAMVAFEFEGKQPTFEEAQTLLRKKFGDNITVERLTVKTAAGEEIPIIRMRTTETDADKVSQGIDEAFAESEFALVRQHVTTGAPAAIATAAEGVAADEFAGGQQASVTISQEMLPSSIRDELAAAFKTVNEQKYAGMETLLSVTPAKADASGKVAEHVVKTAAEVPAADLEKALAALKTDLESEPFFTEKNTFATSVGKEMQLTAVLAIVFSLAAIILYLWFRFHGADFGIAACVALLHDVLFTLGAVALCSYLADSSVGAALRLTDFKINLPMIAAFLTIIGYSLNDTIVVFDRIREVRGKNPKPHGGDGQPERQPNPLPHVAHLHARR